MLKVAARAASGPINLYPGESMVPRHFVVAVIASLLSFSAALHATKASCAFDTFTVPSKYTLNAVEGIGDDGTIVGQVIDNSTQLLMAFMRSPSGVITVYSVPKSINTGLYGQNALGTSAGNYLDSTSKVHGFTLTNGKFTAMNHPNAANTWLFGVNHVGAMAGSYGGGGAVKGYLLVNGKYTTIAYPGGQVTYPMAVNDSNAVVGSSASGWVNNGFLWQNGKFTTINFPNSRFGTILTGINNTGMIVGNHISADKSFGFMYANGVFKGIVYPGSYYTIAGGINNNGVISGQIFLTPTATIGFTATCK
jgi:hypothetical protein